MKLQAYIMQQAILVCASAVSAFATLCLPTNGAVAEEFVPGALNSSYSVSLGGSAQYSIPIAVPEGTSGMAPKLLITYDSNAGPGSMGLGWSVGGISFISRANKTSLVDGRIGPITFTSTDALNLDGLRLIETGSNGSNRIFLKLVDDQTLIEEVPSPSGAYYVAKTKAGLRMYYGDTPQNRIKTSSGKALIWPCVRIEDKFVNTIEFEYIDNVFGDWGIKRAVYTSNASAGLLPYAELRLTYHETDAPSASYVAGEELRRSLLIEKIESGVLDAGGDFKLFRRYNITYDQQQETGRFGSRRVRAITETGAKGDSHRPTTFDYYEPTAGWTPQDDFQLPTAFGSASSLEGGYRVIDVDSDGVPEITYSANFVEGSSGTFTPFRRTYKLTSGDGDNNQACTYLKR